MRPELTLETLAVFEEVVSLPEADRLGFLERSCPDPEIRRAVERMLQLDLEGQDFLSSPLLQLPTKETTFGTGLDFPLRTAGAYRVEGVIGEGGMSRVYFGIRDEPGAREWVAIKVIRRELIDPALRERFHREQELLAGFDHPSIARLLDTGTTADGLPYFVVEYVRGLPITLYCDTHRLTLTRRLELFRRVCAAVHHSHQHLVVHRDLKPANILLTPEGEPKLLDFGIAKLLEVASSGDQTATQVRFLTPNYASPEHIRGERVTTASDIYSLGVLLYELLCGRRPYDLSGLSAADCTALLARQRISPPSAALLASNGQDRGEPMEIPDAATVAECRSTQPDNLRRQLSGDLDNIVLRALRLEPAERYGTAEQLAEDVRRFQDGFPVVARPAGAVYHLVKFVRRHWPAATLGAAVTAVVLLLFAVTLIQRGQLEVERDRALQQRSAAEEQRQQARAGHVLAEHQRAKAEAVTRFLVDSFDLYDRYRRQGASITAQEVIDRGMDRLETDFEAEPEIKAVMMSTLGRAYSRLGFYDEARVALEGALLLQRQLAPQNRIDSADTLNEIARLEIALGEYDSAQSSAGEAVRLLRAELGGPHERLADSLRLQAEAKGRLRQYVEAEETAREALRMDRDLVGADSGAAAADLDLLSMILYWKGDFPVAASLAEEALRLRCRIYGEEHLEVAQSHNNLAVILAETGDPSAAEEHYLDALQIRRTLLGKHALVAETQANLAQLRLRLGEADRAVPLLRDSLAIYEASLGRSHPDVALISRHLADALWAQKDFRGAETAYRRALAVYRERSDTDDPLILPVIHNLANLVLRLDGNYEEAESLLRQALDLRRKLLGERHVDVGRTLLYLGFCRQKEGDLAAAEADYAEALSILRDAGGEEHWQVANVLIYQADLLAATHRLDEAVALARRAVAHYERSFPESNVRVAEARGILGAILLQRGEVDEAEPLLAKSLQEIRAMYGDSAAATLEAEQRLARLPGERITALAASS